MIESYAHVEQKIYSDGKMIENKDIKMNYDGEKIEIDVRDNGDKKHMVLSKDEIMKVFTQPTHSANLMARLKMDFKSNKSNKKTTKNKTHSSKKDKKKTSKNNSKKKTVSKKRS
jgi:hypothetical protein